jgi:hypothetical protein
MFYSLKEGLKATEYDPEGLITSEEGMQSSFIIYVMNGLLNNVCVLPRPSGSHHQHLCTTHSRVC